MNDNKNDKNVNVNVDIDIKVNVDNKKNSSIKEKKVIKKKGFTVKDVLPDDIISLLDKKFNLDKKRDKNNTRKWKHSNKNNNKNTQFKQNHNGENKNWKTRSRINSKKKRRVVSDSPADTKTTA